MRRDAVVQLFVDKVIEGAMEAKVNCMPLEDTCMKVTIEFSDEKEVEDVPEL